MTTHPHLQTLAACLALAALAHASDTDDESRFKPKAYVPRNTAAPKTYTPSRTAPARALQPSQALAPAREARSWSPFGASPYSPSKAPSAARQSTDTPYLPQSPAAEPAAHADAPAAAAQPFHSTAPTPADTPYRNPEVPQEKNPLLAPRQGIKLPE